MKSPEHRQKVATRLYGFLRFQFISFELFHSRNEGVKRRGFLPVASGPQPRQDRFENPRKGQGSTHELWLPPIKLLPDALQAFP